jgi:hypothetical protein
MIVAADLAPPAHMVISAADRGATASTIPQRSRQSPSKLEHVAGVLKHDVLLRRIGTYEHVEIPISNTHTADTHARLCPVLTGGIWAEC